MFVIYICCVTIIILTSIICLKNGMYKLLNIIILGFVALFNDRDEFEYIYMKLTGETTDVYKESRKFLNEAADMAIESKFLYVSLKLGIMLLFSMVWYYTLGFGGIVLNSYIQIAIWVIIFLSLIVVPVIIPIYKRTHDTKDPNNKIKKVNKLFFLGGLLIIITIDIFLIRNIRIEVILLLDFALLILAALIISIYSRIYMNRLIKKYQKEKMDRLNGK